MGAKWRQKNITKKQWNELKIKTLSNVEMILAVLVKNLGTRTEIVACPSEIRPVYFALYSHAVEEYGKFLYLSTLRITKKGKARIEGKIFLDHNEKFKYAKKHMPKSHIEFKTESGKKIKAVWDSRLNIFNTDIDEQNNATDIEDVVKPYYLRMAVNRLFRVVKKEITFIEKQI